MIAARTFPFVLDLLVTTIDHVDLESLTSLLSFINLLDEPPNPNIIRTTYKNNIRHKFSTFHKYSTTDSTTYMDKPSTTHKFPNRNIHKNFLLVTNTQSSEELHSLKAFQTNSQTHKHEQS